MRERKVPKQCAGLCKQAKSGKSLKAACRSMCLECMGYDRAAVRGCEETHCPLWPYRGSGTPTPSDVDLATLPPWLAGMPKRLHPIYRRAMGGKSRKAAIRAHCLASQGWDPEAIRECSSRMCPTWCYRQAGRVTTSGKGSERGLGGREASQRHRPAPEVGVSKDRASKSALEPVLLN